MMKNADKKFDENVVCICYQVIRAVGGKQHHHHHQQQQQQQQQNDSNIRDNDQGE